MKKYLFFAIVSVLALSIVKKAESAGSRIYEGWSYYDLSAASGSITGPLTIKAIVSSTASTTGVWAVVIETNTAAGSVYSSYTSSQKKSPALPLSTSTSINGQTNVLMDYGQDGLFVGTTAFFYLSNAPSGEANKIGVIFSK